MLLAIDAGNTNIVFALYDGADNLQHVWRQKSDSGRTQDEYTALLFTMFQKEGLDFSVVSSAIISSVVPDLNYTLSALCKRNFDCTPVCVDKTIVQDLIKIDLDRPEDVGADRLVNAIAVASHYGDDLPAIVIDFGTATTFDVISRGNVYSGGLISPGVNLSMAALHQAAAKLPKISIRKPDGVIGKDTVHAMQSGVYWGYVGMIEGILERIEDELDESCIVIATGGLARLYGSAIPAIGHIDDELTLKGLHIIHEKIN